MVRFRTCRLCQERARSTDMVRYGLRHYAHYRCYLDAGKSLDELPTVSVGEFPYRLLMEYGLAEHAEAILDR